MGGFFWWNRGKSPSDKNLLIFSLGTARPRRACAFRFLRRCHQKIATTRVTNFWWNRGESPPLSLPAGKASGRASSPVATAAVRFSASSRSTQKRPVRAHLSWWNRGESNPRPKSNGRRGYTSLGLSSFFLASLPGRS